MKNFLGMLGISVFLFSSQSFADSINVNIECPRTKNDGGSSGIFVVHNSSVIIAGSGHEIINGINAIDPIFAGPTPIGVPIEIDRWAYYRNGVFYDSASSKVICHYESSAGKPFFDLSYNLRRGVGGTVAYSTAKSIMITYNFGDSVP